MTDFFTSDTHFWHKKILEYCPNRPFENIEEMNQGLIDRWNERVRPEDHVYHLGDFSFGKYDKTEEILKQLNGNIHLILGNHDRVLDSDLKRYFVNISPYKEFHVKKYGVPVVMFHYPIESWNRMHHKGIHLHGHLHSTSGHHPCEIVPNRMDVGVDAHSECAPWSWDEIKEALSEST
jgi:calcineurin-like phosphoesterase family protein